MNVIIATNKVTERRVVFIVPDNVTEVPVRAKMRQELRDVAKHWSIDVVSGDLVEVVHSPVAVARALK